MTVNKKEINIFETILPALIDSYKDFICYAITNQHIENNENISFEVFPEGGFTFRNELGYTTHQNIGKLLTNKEEVENAIKTSLEVYNKRINELREKDINFTIPFFPLIYMQDVSKQFIDYKDNTPAYWSCQYKIEVPAYETIETKENKDSPKIIKCNVANADLQIDVNTKGRIIGMKYNLLPFRHLKTTPLFSVLNKEGEIPQINYLLNSSTSKLTPFYLSTGETTYVPACKESILPKDIEKPKSNTDAFGVYYMLEPYCIRVGQVGKNTDVRLINEGVEYEYAKKKIDEANNVLKIVDLKSEEGKMALEIINTFSKKNSTSVGMKEEELYTRAFLTLIRQTEAHGNEVTPYNRKYGGGYFTNKKEADVKGQLSSDNSYKKHPGDDDDEPAGAYQIKKKTFNWIKSSAGVSDFFPQSQDKVAIELIQYRGAYEYVKSGNFKLAFMKLLQEWTSLPGANEQGKGIDINYARNQYKENISIELKKVSFIATPIGKLIKKS